MTTTISEEQLTRASSVAAEIRNQISNAVVGQADVIDQIVCALIAAGHVLIEGVPGLGKTLLVRALAQTFGGNFSRIQFTPDLMPDDVTGHTIYDQYSGQLTTRRGPVSFACGRPPFRSRSLRTASSSS